MAKIPEGKVRWECPRCQRAFALRAESKPPELCPHCKNDEEAAASFFGRSAELQATADTLIVPAAACDVEGLPLAPDPEPPAEPPFEIVLTEPRIPAPAPATARAPRSLAYRCGQLARFIVRYAPFTFPGILLLLVLTGLLVRGAYRFLFLNSDHSEIAAESLYTEQVYTWERESRPYIVDISFKRGCRIGVEHREAIVTLRMQNPSDDQLGRVAREVFEELRRDVNSSCPDAEYKKVTVRVTTPGWWKFRLNVMHDAGRRIPPWGKLEVVFYDELFMPRDRR